MAITYEYRCDTCEEEFTVEQSIKDDPLTECQFCKDGKVHRLISEDGTFILKGEGWFSDLYSKPSQNSNDNNE